uniref:Globin family profile domain-containing protein n=1 Tax=Globodera rostochiensis TaxID=31243 RepID=A0A914GV19_GLORO
MGNHQTNCSQTDSPSSSTQNLEAVVRKSALSKNARLKLAELREQQRRRSVAIIAMETVTKEKVEPHNNYRSFTFGQSPFNSLDSQSDAAPFGGSSSEGLSGSKKALEPPRIEINGTIEHCCAVNGGESTNGGNHSAGLNANSGETNSGDQRRGSGASIGFNKHKAHKVDSRKITHKKRLERGQTTTISDDKSIAAAAADHRAPALKFFRRPNECKFARSLDRYNADICAEMHPLSLRTAAGGAAAAARSMSPLMHQQRRVFSSGSSSSGGGRGSGSAMTYAGDDDVLSWEQADAVQRSWRRANNRIEQFGIGADRCFAFYAFDRIFERAPELKPLFGISPSFLLTDLDEQEQQQQQHMHPFMRHLHVFNNILDLSVRNAAELKTEMLPALFTYGQRHYQPKLKDEFGERTVRLFCSQVVGTMCDLLADDFSPTELEAWIEMVTYLGRALLSGFEHERLQSGRKRSSQRF